MVYPDNEIAYVYIATKGGQTELLYQMSIEDAKKVCSADETRGASWSLFWTTKRKFERYADINNIKWRKDDGRFNDLFQELKVKVL